MDGTRYPIAVLRQAAALCRAPLLIALTHVALFDAACYYVYSGGSYSTAFFAALLCTAKLVPLFFIVAMLPSWGRWLVPVEFFASAVATYFVVTYKVELSADTLALLYESDVSEAHAFVGATLAGWVAACTAAGVLLARRIPLAKGLRWPAGAVALVVMVPLYQWGGDLRRVVAEKLPAQLPYVLWQQSSRYFAQRHQLEHMLAGKQDISRLPLSAKGDDVEAVLVIGESARSDHFQLNGYARDTTPKLAARGVVSYPNSLACGNRTRISVPCLLTRAGIGVAPEQLADESSLISVFNAAGFGTQWLSNQRVMHGNDTITTALAAEAGRSLFNRSSYRTARDEVILPAVADHLQSAGRRHLTVVHTVGSHWAYQNRYPKELERFKPACDDSNPQLCSREELVNAYDNSILATDAFLASVIDLLEDRDAFLIYVSDHGESLGEDGYYGHGQAVERLEQRLVPFLFWASDTFKARHPERYRRALELGGNPLTHDFVFHSMLRCAGIDGEVVDRAYSLCG